MSMQYIDDDLTALDFVELLDLYLEMKNIDDSEYEGHVPGYTNKAYYMDRARLANELNKRVDNRD